MIVVIDNYDSFVFNLVQLLGSMGQEIRVFRNDAITVGELRALRPDHLVLSPGPGHPEEAGITIDAIRQLSDVIPTLGVCLGHQAIAAAFDGRVIRADQVRHGKASDVEHDGQGLFAGLPHPLESGRYHSLAATRVPESLEVCATTEDGEVMAVRHRELPVVGIQFHPESVLTPDGPALAKNFLDGKR